MKIQDAKAVIVLKSGETGGLCPIGSQVDRTEDDLEVLINGYLAEGCKLVHVGTETETDRDGRPWHRIVAVLVSDRPQVGPGPSVQEYLATLQQDQENE